MEMCYLKLPIQIKGKEMSRPDYITEEDIKRWTEIFSNDPIMKNIKMGPVFIEVCFAGQYLREKLEQLSCADELIVRICYTAGKMSFGRDPWDVSDLLLKKYETDELVLESDPNAETN
jgi:hypothetical protein